MPKWTLYGQTLDLEEFKKNHPGGELAILLGEERDCTRLFEQYHCRNASNQVVLKQIAAQQGKEINPTITDPFQQEVLQMAYDYKGGYTASGPKRIFLCISGFILAALWIGWFSGSWIACILLPIITWIFAVNVGHDAAHFAFSDSPLINQVLSFTPSPLYFTNSVWYAEHNISHHGYTNEVGRDMDIHIGEPFIKAYAGSAMKPKSSWRMMFDLFVYSTLTTFAESTTYPILFMLKDKKITDFVGNYDALLKYCRPHLLITFSMSALFISLPFFLFNWPKAIAFVLIPYIIGSFIFVIITQVSHIQEEVQHEIPNENWMRQMVQSSMDYSQDSAFWSLITGGLNMQSIHHCLPAIDSSHFMELYPKFRAICEKHGVKINEVPTLWDAFNKYCSYIYKLSQEQPVMPKGEGCPHNVSKVD
jgi:fatty acid desaturase